MINVPGARMAVQRTEEDWQTLWSEITESFSPGAPVQERDLFAGRQEQLRTLMDTVQQRGRHAVVFGERGVGKTSITNILGLVLRGPRRDVISVKVNADPQDTYESIWKKVFKRLNYETQRESGETVVRTIADDYAGRLTPDDVQLELSNFAAHQIPLIVLDEFDRISDPGVTQLMADTIKALSDYSVNATVVVVGVAEDVTGLIKGHESIARSLIQVRMPRMSQDELGEIILSRYKKCGIKVGEEALWKMTFLARGIPYYAHLLGMHAARAAIKKRTAAVDDTCVDAAQVAAVAELDASIKDRYFAAVRSQRNDDTLFAPVLLACALAKTDELGAFQQAAVTEPLNRIVPGRNYKPSTFAFHMNAFCEDQRKRVLEKFGEPRNQRYRFTDPMMPPFVVVKGLADGLIDDEIAEVYANRRQLRLSTEW
ncbi:MAG: ATP-binding protein [Pseudomonadota bacterium]